MTSTNVIGIDGKPWIESDPTDFVDDDLGPASAEIVGMTPDQTDAFWRGVTYALRLSDGLTDEDKRDAARIFAGQRALRNGIERPRLSLA